jgi:copper chaperone
MESCLAGMQEGRRLHDIGDVPGHGDDLRALRAVSGELRALDGVSDVTAVLVPGGASAVTVTSNGPLARQVVADALGEAGDYQLAGS